MRKFFLGVLVGGVVAVFGIFIIVLVIGRLAASRQPTIAPNSALVLTLQGGIPEVPPVDIPLPFAQAQSEPTVRDLWASLHAAATDNRIKAVILQPRDLSAGWGKLQEIREELVNFKTSGKPVYAMLAGGGSREYYLASVADRIFLQPDDTLDVKGFLLEAMYLKNALDKLGIDIQVDHIGRYKDAGDIFTKANMSPETREVLGQVLDQLYADFCSTVGQGRHKTADEIRALVDQGPFIAAQAKSSGLVDELGYEDQVYGELKKKVGGELNRTSIKTYFRAVPGRGDHIAMLVGAGEIQRGEPDGSLNQNDVIASAAFVRTIRQVRNDSSIKGVILRIDSPGGDAGASDEILHQLKLLSRVKPVVVSMSDYAASGGYFISVTGDPIVAYPDTVTGSIGVLYIRPNVRNLYNKLGIQEELLMRGKLADLDSESEPLSDAGRQKLHESIQATYTSFVSKVAAARKKSYDQIDPLAQGRVWMGAQARQNGLIDELGGLNRAIALVRRRAHLSPTGDTNLITYPPRRTLLDILTSSPADVFADAIAERKLRQALPALPSRLLLKGGVLRILPYRLEIR
ncbi:MAG: signal peptide peptidase SppA [Acidobacteriaceae bacterium]|nr:signal peptide peptidase SppA [Acidobacteriaceae bacterium]MBV9779991.1 signal peptide peptidase SppA [Acidobacteriaceae bacterium]